MGKLRVIAKRQISELERKWSAETKKLYEQALNLFKQVVTQQKHDKDKVYSLHKPFTACIAKGKPYKKYEFGPRGAAIRRPCNAPEKPAYPWHRKLHW